MHSLLSKCAQHDLGCRRAIKHSSFIHSPWYNPPLLLLCKFANRIEGTTVISFACLHIALSLPDCDNEKVSRKNLNTCTCTNIGKAQRYKFNIT